MPIHRFFSIGQDKWLLDCYCSVVNCEQHEDRAPTPTSAPRMIGSISDWRWSPAGTRPIEPKQNWEFNRY